MVDATHHGAAVGGDHGDNDSGQTRRDFLSLAAGTIAAVASAEVAWTLVNSMNPAADTLALSTTEVNLAPITEGMGITVMWQSKPVFVRHRTADEIAAAQKDDHAADLIDPNDARLASGKIVPATDQARVQRPPWLVLIGICTHLGCIPVGNKPSDDRGQWGGYRCPCHGSQYDTSGRVRHGPAGENLHVPPYSFPSDTVVRVG